MRVLVLGVVAVLGSIGSPWSGDRGRADDDVITLRRNTDVGNPYEVRGEVLEWTGRQIVVRTKQGKTRKYAAAAVLEVTTNWPPQRQAATVALARTDFATASRQLAAALRAETRPWARRVISSELIGSYRGQQRWPEACELFLALARSDPATPAYDRIPLAWFPRDAISVDTAKSWLGERDQPAATLLGASYLIGTVEQRRAVEPLRNLSRHGDARIAALATAQSWRLRAAPVDSKTVRQRTHQVESMPESIRAGAYFLLAEAWTRAGEPDRAALAYWRVPLLYPQQRDLAARCLLEVGRQAVKQGRRDEAQRALQEGARVYGETIDGRAAAEILNRLTRSQIDPTRLRIVGRENERTSR